MLLRPRPDRAIRGRRSKMATRGTGGFEDTPTHMSEVMLHAESPAET